jgi:hypothetical protein
MAEVRLNKDGTPDKRFKKKGGKIQEIIDSQQAPGVVIAAHHKAGYTGPKVDMEKYKRDTKGKDPHMAMDHSVRTQCGRDMDIDRTRCNSPANRYRNPEL